MFLQLKEQEGGTEIPAWQMLMHECSLSLSFTAAFLSPDYFRKAGVVAAFWYSSPIPLRFPDSIMPQTLGDIWRQVDFPA